MELTPRLEAIAASIGKCGIAADIGSDHAYLPIYLIKSGKADKVIASDINKGPAEISMKRIKKYCLEQYIDVRVGDGLKVLHENEAEVIVIAGMGGLLIKSLLSEGMHIARSAQKIILQPMRDSQSLIKWLISNSFEIQDGEIIKENNKFYKILWTRYNKNKCNSSGFHNEAFYYNNTLVLHEYIESKINEYSKIIDHLKGSDTSNNRRRIEECYKELESYKEVRECLILNVER